MKFKKFLLEEGFDYSNVDTGDILSVLQQLHSDMDHIKKKDLINSLENLIFSMRNLLNPRSDKSLVLIIQKIICAIKDDIELNGDLKSTIESSIYELENYFKQKKVVLNKPLDTSTGGDALSEPVAKQSPEEVKSNQDINPALDKNFSLQSPPLAGSGDNLIPTV